MDLKVAGEIQADLDAILNAVDGVNTVNSGSIRAESNFAGRAAAMDFIEINVLDRIAGSDSDSQAALSSLEADARRIMAEMEAIDEKLFRRLRNEIRAGGRRGTDFLGMLHECVGFPYHDGGINPIPDGEPGYDILDAFINGLLHFRPIPVETMTREPEMVYFQKTPARIVLEMIAKAPLTESDVFLDLGSGLGQVPILVHLATGAAAGGIECEPAFCGYARACAEDLDLPGVPFLATDARAADYSAGTVYFMYTPFEGGMLRTVLGKMEREARPGMKLFTYGPCTAEVGRQKWLRSTGANPAGIHRLGAFERR